MDDFIYEEFKEREQDFGITRGPEDLHLTREIFSMTDIGIRAIGRFWEQGHK